MHTDKVPEGLVCFATRIQKVYQEALRSCFVGHQCTNLRLQLGDLNSPWLLLGVDQRHTQCRPALYPSNCSIIGSAITISCAAWHHALAFVLRHLCQRSSASINRHIPSRDCVVSSILISFVRGGVHCNLGCCACYWWHPCGINYWCFLWRPVVFDRLLQQNPHM